MTSAILEQEESFTSWLAACDEMLAVGLRPEALNDVGLEPVLHSRLTRGVACLQRLQELWPVPETSFDLQSMVHTGEPILTRLGRFELKNEIGRGGFGVVYLALDTELQREVALKIPRLDVLLEPRLRQRLAHEAQAAARLDHPLIVPVYEAGAIGIVSYIASAYCPGPTLAHWLSERSDPMPACDAAALIADLADAVQHAHSRGVLHCDLKPANLLVGYRLSATGPRQEITATPGTPEPPSLPKADSRMPMADSRLPIAVRVTDFGLARILTEAGRETSASTTIAGTASYMAPEQAEGRAKDIGTATDVYGLGAVLYELLTGQPPFRGDSMLTTLEQVRTSAPVPPRRLRCNLPGDLQAICLKCLQKEPGRRYASAAALADDLHRFLHGEPIRARPVGVLERTWKWACRKPAWAALAIVVLASVVAGVGLHIQQRTQEVRQRQQVRAALRELVFGAERVLAPKDGLDLRPGLPPGEAFEHSQQLFAELESAPENVRDPGLRHELARAARLVAEIHDRLKVREKARQALGRAHALLESLVAELPEERLYRLDLAAVLCRQAELCDSPAERRAALDRARELLAELVERHPDQPAFQRELERVERLREDAGRGER